MEQIINEADLCYLVASEPLFKDVVATYGMPAGIGRPPVFSSLVQIILEQQVSLASAQAHYTRLSLGVPALAPEHILCLTDTQMRDSHISRQKATCLRALSAAILEGSIDMDSLRYATAQQVRARLTAIKGIGPWTADIFLMFCMQAKDIFPSGDMALRHSMRRLTHTDTPEEMILRAAAWKPFRSLAAVLLWHHYTMSRTQGG